MKPTKKLHPIKQIQLFFTLTLFNILVILVIPSPSWAATYYVDATNGNDSNDGLSQTTAWKTIAKINSSNFEPGDKILLKRGELWRETLIPSSSGTNGSSIIFDAYGSGTNPIISGSELIPPGTSWSNSSYAHIWQSFEIKTEPKIVMINNNVGTKEMSIFELTAEYDWFWDSNVLSVYSATDPDTAYTNPGIEIGQRPYCLTWNVKSYLTFNNIDFVAGNKYGIYMDGTTSNIIFDSCGLYKAYEEGINHHGDDQASYVTIQDSKVAYNGACGIVMTGNTDHWTIKNNTVYNNGYTDESGGVENTWGAGIKMVGARGRANGNSHVVEYNDVYYTGYKDAGITRVHTGPNKGFGIWSDMTDGVTVASQGDVVRYNKVHDNADSGLFIEKSRYCSYYYNLSYNNAQYGLRMDADENGLAVQDNYVYNNTLYNNVSGLYVAGGWAKNGNYVKDNIFKNNISYGNTLRQLLCKWGGENDGSLGSGNVYENNCFGHQQTNFIEWGQGTFQSTYSSWEKAYMRGTFSINADPLFKYPLNHDFTLQPASPCINAGTPVGITKDFNGNLVPFGSNVDVGAFEYNSTDSTQVACPPVNLRLIDSN